MRSNIDDIILVMRKVIEISHETELDEQSSTADTTADTGTKPEYPTVTKWESGVTRGPANQIAVVKWSDIVKVTRGKANTLI